MKDLMNNVGKNCHSEPLEAISEMKENEFDFQVFMWEGGIHTVPKDFKFPSVNLAVAWSLWNEGNKQIRIYPYRQIKSYLQNEWKRAMNCIEKLYKRIFQNTITNSQIPINQELCSTKLYDT
jgi:hypothetical protein